MINQYKKGCGYSYISGYFPLMYLLEYKKEYLDRIYVSEKALNSDAILKIKKLVDSDKIIVSSKAVEKLGEKDNDYVIGVFKTYEEKLLDKEDHVVLVNPMDLGNIGNIMRSMLAFGYSNLAIVTPSGDYFNPKTIRSSMGAFFKMRIQSFSSFEEYKEKYPRDYYPFILQTDRLLSSIESVNKNPIALVFGNEAQGLSKDIWNNNSIKIEQSNEVDSLNLATSVAIALHDFKYRIKRK